MENDFLITVTEELATLFNSLLSDSAGGMFRRQHEVMVGGSPTGDSNYHLYLVGKEITQSDRGTFSTPVDKDTHLVFRSPSVMQLSYLMCAQGLPPKQVLRAQDRLMTFFFDNKMMEPILPESLLQHAALAERLKSRHAELKIREEASLLPPHFRTSEGLSDFRFAFDYSGLYHSGNYVRQESRAKVRVIEFANETNERSS